MWLRRTTYGDVLDAGVASSARDVTSAYRPVSFTRSP